MQSGESSMIRRLFTRASPGQRQIGVLWPISQCPGPRRYLSDSHFAESYVAGFAGYGLSAQLSDVRGTGDIADRTGSNLGLQNSPIYGLKVGALSVIM